MRLVNVFLACAIACSQIGVFANDANHDVMANMNPSVSNPDPLRDRIKAGWAPNPTTKKGMTWIETWRPKSNFADAKIMRSSGDAQFDSDCLQAFLGAEHAVNDATGVFAMGFETSEIPKIHKQLTGIEEFFQKHSELNKDKFLAYRRIPLDVLLRYPDTFNDGELMAASNVAVVSNDSATKVSEHAQEKLKKMYTESWIPFFRTHPKATKEEVLQFESTVN